jgi:hypothetical protein
VPSPLERWRQRSRASCGDRFSARLFECGGRLDEARCQALREALSTFGGVHAKHTGLTSLADVQGVLEALGFGDQARFELGGRTTAAVQTKWVAPGLRRMDHYPPELYLLPNNEVQYRKVGPRWVMFACLEAPVSGGRVFLHDAEEFAARLPPELLARLERHGLRIETGFLDARSPHKAGNYFQSWQERFGTEDRDEALARALAEPDEYDACWFLEDGTLMTQLSFPARWQGWLRFPRVALDGPAPHNGYRRFPLGNGEALSAADEEAIREAAFDTRQGLSLERGDLVLFDNLRFGHSREPFEGPREVVVAMAGRLALGDTEPTPTRRERPRLTTSGPERYATSREPERRFSARVFDAEGTLDFARLNAEFERWGALHVKRTGLACAEPGALPPDVLRGLRVGDGEAFPWGGLASGRTTRKALSRELRATDTYPSHLWLLPHNEVLYQRNLPARLLFFSARAQPGRTFVHSAKRLEAWLRANGGTSLLEALAEHGLRIEMGFLDERHPEKAKNYFRSWQDRFDTDDPREAEARCRAARHQFDDCWWLDDGTLMTRIRVPAFHNGTLLFPRIALDAPAARNGFRRYPLGHGQELNDAEVDLLLHGFLETREGVSWEAGDLLLCDNVRYGHSREAFDGPRELGVAMAGSVEVLT